MLTAPSDGGRSPSAPARRGRSRPCPAQAPQRSAGAMARGALLGAVACLCFLAPAAEAFKRRGPSVTAKVTLARGRGRLWKGRAAPAAGMSAAVAAVPGGAGRPLPAPLWALRAWGGLGQTPGLLRFIGFFWLVGTWFLTPFGVPPLCRRWHTAELGPAKPRCGFQKGKLLNFPPVQRGCGLCCCQGSSGLLASLLRGLSVPWVLFFPPELCRNCWRGSVGGL